MNEKMQKVVLEIECSYIVSGTVKKIIEIPEELDPDDYEAFQHVEALIDAGKINVTDLIFSKYYFNEDTRKVIECDIYVRSKKFYD